MAMVDGAIHINVLCHFITASTFYRQSTTRPA